MFLLLGSYFLHYGSHSKYCSQLKKLDQNGMSYISKFSHRLLGAPERARTRDQRSETRDQKSEVGDQKSEVGDHFIKKEEGLLSMPPIILPIELHFSVNL